MGSVQGVRKREQTIEILRTAALASALALASTALAADLTISAPTNAQDAGSLSVILAPSYAGMGIEPSNLLSFTGTTSRNELTYQLLANLGNYTGKPSHIRLGGNSGDNMLYNANVNSYTLIDNPNSSGQGGVATDAYYYGPNYYKALDMLPKGTPITYGLNLAYTGSDAFDRIVEQAKITFSSLQNVEIVGLEIGNEPDLFFVNGYRPQSWTSADYGVEWSQRAAAIYNEVLKPLNLPSNFFEPAATATTATDHGHQFRISNLVDTEVATGNGIYVAGWNQHDYYYYVNVSTYTLTADLLLDFSTTRSQLSEWSRQAQQAAVTGKPYYLREMGSVGPGGLPGISETFANTLWTFNFFLYAATQQMSSVQMHLTDVSLGSPWQPITVDGVAPHVRSSYYAYAAMAQIIGAKCNTRIASIDVSGPSSYNNRLTAYGSYQNNRLNAIVLINSQTTQSTSSNKPSLAVDFQVPGFTGTAYVSTLIASGTDSTRGTTWNGMSYEQSSNGAATRSGPAVQQVQINNGVVSVNIRDGSAIVVAFGSALGSDTTVDDKACNALAATSSEGGATSTDGTTGAAPTFKATNGFRSDQVLTKEQIIGVAAGGGAFIIIALISIIALCVGANGDEGYTYGNLGGYKSGYARPYDSPKPYRESGGFDSPRTYAGSGYDSPRRKDYPIEMEAPSPRFANAARHQSDNASAGSRRPLIA
ncbi:hypothetical protein IE81DRAFT_337270 [Ceraceosorus guamensis]|uniref:Beta-glucuronidase C-terminal domain-containing protein n=1 Tax=Ceraceosorus guamensis TaxID=1522189 RepID=A0A316W1V8_9BASI|nr:hypothetical protein IE81DRAFT_337270 [Ceraceosorus guamensis]PWN42753.1 hypothetical protein IE81DRAFT_337270 [Ceraceosorus guamensis]